jgi:16S rRNA (uracil1498-N3)-methyltransferase
MTSLPLFYCTESLLNTASVALDAETFRHVFQVLRMKDGEKISLTDGKGILATGRLRTKDKKNGYLDIDTVVASKSESVPLHIGVAFTKSNTRNEWMVEKLTEMGVASITPLDTVRSEKTRYRMDRWEKITVSAILQSQQYFLPDLSENMALVKFIEKHKNATVKLIAHCIDDPEKTPLSEVLKQGCETVILIGPEGDFTTDEVNLCKQNGYRTVSLSAHRLRTETAAIVACAVFQGICNGK